MGEERRSVERFFGAHAEEYAKSPSHAHGADLAALLEALNPKHSDQALDVATGTGFTAAALGPHVRHVIGIDVTGAMLVEARKLVRNEGLGNVEFENGDALNMRFGGSSFDIVTTRRATHHFHDVPRFLAEAHRILRTGGRLGVVDMSPPEGAEAFSNKIERLRDGSHAEAFTPATWRSMVSRAGFHIQALQVLGEHVPFERWLYPVEPGGDAEVAIRRAWDASGPDVRRLLKADFDGVIKGWTKFRVVLVATK